MKKLAYLKNLKDAFKTYNDENDVIDFELIQRMYDYANRLDELTDVERQQLDDFLAENTISIEHLANIYLDKKGEENLNHMLTRMYPIQVTKPQCRIRFIKGKESILTGAIYQENKMKVLCKTRKKMVA